MSLYEAIIAKREKISVIGLGYVGLPLAIAFAKKTAVVGFDLSEEKIAIYKSGIDPMKEIGDDAVRKTTVKFTANEADLQKARFHIVSVPTPIKADKTPNLQSVETASEIVGRNLMKGSIVVYESTVYPGVTEDICIPILERESGLICGKDFKVGYSPERINPGDKVNTLENITKIVSGMDEETLEVIAKVYELIITAGVHKASTIKVAEAAKVVENSQRDINIAFMNELAMVFDRMDIDTVDVMRAMETKWNALNFRPGLVGGHCIGVDPYYFIYEAERLGYHSQIILSGRKINDGMSKFVADAILKQLILANKVVKQAKIVILGVTFKENTADIRNSKVIEIINELREYEVDPVIVDPLVNKKIAKQEYGIDVLDMDHVRDADCLVFAVPHDHFRHIPNGDLDRFFANVKNSEKVIIDVKGFMEMDEMVKQGYRYWRL